MSGTTLDARVVDGVAELVLDRPDRANAVDLTMARELHEVTLRWANDPAVRAVLVRGRGERFCGGGDLRSFAGRDDLPEHLTEVTTYLHAAIARLARMDAPVIAAVQGSAAGAGFSLACSCDIVLAARSARFLLAYADVGLSPDGSATWYLPRLVGLRRALDLALTGRVLSADEAHEWGLVTAVVDDDALASEAQRLAARIARGPTAALGHTKRLLRASGGRDLEAQMEAESRALARSAGTPDGREGIAAFTQKRAPRFGP